MAHETPFPIDSITEGKKSPLITLRSDGDYQRVNNDVLISFAGFSRLEAGITILTKFGLPVTTEGMPHEDMPTRSRGRKQLRTALRYINDRPGRRWIKVGSYTITYAGRENDSVILRVDSKNPVKVTPFPRGINAFSLMRESLFGQPQT